MQQINRNQWGNWAVVRKGPNDYRVVDVRTNKVAATYSDKAFAVQVAQNKARRDADAAAAAFIMRQSEI